MKLSYMKKILYLPLLVLWICTGCSKGKTTAAPFVYVPPVTPPVVVVPGTTVSDTILNGINLQPSYYNDGNPNVDWALMKQETNIKTVRIEIEPDKATQAKTWIAQAKTNGLTVIATYHKYTVLGSDDATELTTAANWWKNNYAALGGNFIINMMNEWGSHNITPAAYATAYNSAIAIVRTVYSGPIVIDIPGWGQETFTAYQAVKISNPVIADTNIILSAHIYPNGWNQGRNHNIQPSDLDDITNTGRRGIVGEFGNGATGNVDWAACVDKAKLKGWPVLGWCWNGDGGAMNMVQPSWASNATANSFTLSAYFSVIYNKL